jgi:hypothetical protein
VCHSGPPHEIDEAGDCCGTGRMAQLRETVDQPDSVRDGDFELVEQWQ